MLRIHFDILAGKVKIDGDTVVVGGGLVGLEVAEYLSGDVGKITVVEMLDEVGKDLGQLRKICVMENLYKEGITTITNAKCVEIKDSAVVIEKEDTVEKIPCGYVVVSIGSRARENSEISKYCDENNIPYHIIGDALKARRALNSIKEAVDVARQI